MHGTLAAEPASASPERRGTGFGLILRLALREMRAGLRGFWIFIGCIALGTAAISGVSSIARSLVEGIATQGGVILGGDLALSLIQRDASPEELAAMRRQGRVSSITTLRAMSVSAGEGETGGAALVEMKAVDAAYPTAGAVTLDPPAPLAAALSGRGGAFGAVADPALFDRLGLRPGARITLGAANFELRARLLSEPDKIASGIGFGPRLLVSEDGLAATGLIQPGSLFRRTYRVLLPPDRNADEAPSKAVDAIRADMPGGGAGWEIRTRDNADPRFSRNIERFAQFLTLVGLTALLVGGVGVANAVSAFIDRKRTAIGIFKTLGATGSRIVPIYLVQVLMVAGIGIAVGIAVGATLPFVVAGIFSAMLPIPITPVLSVLDLGLALLFGLLTALAFSLGPLGRAHGIPVSGLFRDRAAPGTQRAPLVYRLGALLCGAALVAVAIGAAQDRRVALVFVAAAGGAFVLLRLVSWLIMAVARRVPRPRNTVLRLAVVNLYRPGALTPSLVLSLGLGITLLVTLAVIDANLRHEITRTLPARAPNFFFVDVPSADSELFRAYLAEAAPGSAIEEVPMMRGRITELNGRPVAEAKPAPEASWVLDGDRGVTYASAVPEGSTVTAGAWWKPDVAGPPLVSFDDEIARGLGLKVGDTVTVNVLGRTMTATVANLRHIDWRRLGISFVMVFSPQSFRGAPHTELMTLALPRDADPAIEPRILRDAARRFPAITSVRVKDALDAINDIVSQLVLAIRIASSVALAASLLVLAGALAAGHQARLYDAVVLKTVGATRMRLLAAYLAEYGLLGVTTALFGLAFGTAAAFYVVTGVMRLDFAPSLDGAVASAGLAVVIAVGLGLLGTWRILGRKPARYLRTL